MTLRERKDTRNSKGEQKMAASGDLALDRL